MTIQAPASAGTNHPLSSLTAEEIEAASELLRRAGRMGPDVRVHGMISGPTVDRDLGGDALTRWRW